MRDRYLHEKTQVLSNDENCSLINPAPFWYILPLARESTRSSPLGIEPIWTPYTTPRTKGTTFSDLGGPFLVQVNDSFFRQTASYPRGETMADGTFVFVDVKIFNNSDRPLRIPYFTLQDSRGRTYPTAIRARRSRNAILAGESLNPGVAKAGYLIFDVPRISASDSLPFRDKLGVANSRYSLDFDTIDKRAN